MKNKLISSNGIIWITFALFFFLPFERIPTFEVMGFTLKISYFFGLLLLLSALTCFKDFRIKFDKSDIFLALFLIYGLISIFWAEDTNRAVIIWLLWLFMVLIYKLISSIKIDEEKKDIIFHTILFSTLVVCFFGIYQFVGDSLGMPEYLTGLRYQYTKAIMGFPRIQSVALEPLYFSNFLILPFFLALKMYFEQKKCLGSCIFLLILISANIFLGVSRGAYLALAITLFILFAYLAIKKEWKKIFKTILVLLASFLISISLMHFLNGKEAINTFFNHIVARETGTEVSTTGRIEVYKEAWQTFKENPLGIGVASWGVKHQGVVDYTNIRSFGNVNNQYLEILVEMGVIGFVLFILFLVFYFIEAFKIIKDSKDKLMPVMISLAIVAILIQYNFFSTLYIIYIWVFMGLLKIRENDKTQISNDKKQDQSNSVY